MWREVRGGGGLRQGKRGLGEERRVKTAAPAREAMERPTGARAQHLAATIAYRI
jgi:hypothetical protein